MFLLRLHRLALRLRPLLPLCYGVGGTAAVLAMALLLLQEAAAPGLLGLAVVLSVWALMLYAFIRLFQSIPPPVLPKDPFLTRLLSRCRLALYQLLALGVVGIAIVLAAMSLKLVSASLR